MVRRKLIVTIDELGSNLAMIEQLGNTASDSPIRNDWEEMREYLSEFRQAQYLWSDVDTDSTGSHHSAAGCRPEPRTVGS